MIRRSRLEARLDRHFARHEGQRFLGLVCFMLGLGAFGVKRLVVLLAGRGTDHHWLWATVLFDPLVLAITWRSATAPIGRHSSASGSRRRRSRSLAVPVIGGLLALVAFAAALPSRYGPRYPAPDWLQVPGDALLVAFAVALLVVRTRQRAWRRRTPPAPGTVPDAG